MGETDARIWLQETYDELASEIDDLDSLADAYKRAVSRHYRCYNKEIKETGQSDLVDLGRARRYNRVDDRGPFAAEDNTHNPKPGGYDYDVMHPETRQVCKKPSNGYRFPRSRFEELYADDRIVFGPDHTTLFKVKKYVSEMGGPLRSVLLQPDGRLGIKTLRQLLPEAAERFPYPKPVELIELLLGFAAERDALVLDPFAGTGTTGHAVLRANAEDGGNRRFVLIEEGVPGDPFCRTIVAPRIIAAIEQEDLSGGFQFLETGQQLDRAAILSLERKAIASLILQTDTTAGGRRLMPVAGTHVIGRNLRGEAVCLRWDGRENSHVDAALLGSVFKEVDELGLRRPVRIYASTCEVGESDSFTFCQIPDEIMAALNLQEDEGLVDENGEAV